VPRHLRRSTFGEDEPEVVEAALVWCEMRIAGQTKISFAQFYTDILRGKLGTQARLGTIQSYMRGYHGEVYTRATSRP
jgi:hypothetical protein